MGLQHELDCLDNVNIRYVLFPVHEIFTGRAYFEVLRVRVRICANAIPITTPWLHLQNVT